MQAAGNKYKIKQHFPWAQSHEKIFNICRKAPVDFNYAGGQAINKICEMIAEPLFIAWKYDNTKHFAQAIPDDNRNRRHDYGENFDGHLELTVADKYHFIFTDRREYKRIWRALWRRHGRQLNILLNVENTNEM